MKEHELSDPPDPRLAELLAAFEAQFTYPLGPGRMFRISHGQDYPRFFRSMGPARVFVVEAWGQVVGTVGVSVRELTMPDGSSQRAAYIGDVKIAPHARGGKVLHRLSRAVDAWVRPQVTCAFGVVMDGTETLPSVYTGRAGVPPFVRVGELSLRRLPASRQLIDSCGTASPDVGVALYQKLSAGYASASSVDPSARSSVPPEWIISPDGLACGRLEDTRRAKSLWLDSGEELASAHLACFAWRSPAAAMQVLESARRRAAGAGLPAVFISLDASDAALFDEATRAASGRIAGAAVYGVNLAPGMRWSISSSEV